MQLFVVLTLWVVIALLLLSPTARETFRVVASSYNAMQDALASPAAKNLVAIGCDGAAITKLGRLMAPMEKASKSLSIDWDKTYATPDTTWVQCINLLGSKKVPDCEEVARAFGSSGYAPGEFIVYSGRTGEEGCGGYFRPDGTKIGGLILKNFDLVREP